MSVLTLAEYRQAIIDGYANDTQFSKALQTGVESGIYIMKDGLLYLTHPDQQRLCIPNIKVKGRRDNAQKSL